jgi:ATP-dependent exoDNAse (exonuclease V) beta subunit
LQEEKIKEILQELLEKRKYIYVKVNILYNYVMGNYNMDISDKLRAMFQAIHKDYIEYKQKFGLYDFTDLPQYLLDKLNDYDRGIEDIDALFVDEFQDVDDIQLELFERVSAAKRFYIGDPQQSIYIFRGATEDVMKKLRGFKMYNLDVNYRSNQEIIDFASTFQNEAVFNPILFSGQLESYKSSILAEKGDGGEVYVLNRTGSAYKVNEYIK